MHYAKRGRASFRVRISAPLPSICYIYKLFSKEYSRNMLTKEDIKELRNVFREEIEAEVGTMRDELTSQIILTKMELRSDFGGVENRLKNVEIKLGRLEKTVNVAIKMFNEDDTKLVKRIKNIESHLDIVPKN